MTFIIDGNCEIIESINSETLDEEFIFIAKDQNVFMFEIRNTEDKILAENIVLSFSE